MGKLTGVRMAKQYSKNNSRSKDARCVGCGQGEGMFCACCTGEMLIRAESRFEQK